MRLCLCGVDAIVPLREKCHCASSALWTPPRARQLHELRAAYHLAELLSEPRMFRILCTARNRACLKRCLRRQLGQSLRTPSPSHLVGWALGSTIFQQAAQWSTYHSRTAGRQIATGNRNRKLKLPSTVSDWKVLGVSRVGGLRRRWDSLPRPRAYQPHVWSRRLSMTEKGGRRIHRLNRF